MIYNVNMDRLFKLLLAIDLDIPQESQIPSFRIISMCLYL